LVTWLSLSYLLVDRRDLYESIPQLGLSPVLRDVLVQSPPLLVWLILWSGGIVLALVGSRRTMPFIGWVARRPRLLRVAFVGNVVLLFGAMLTTVLAVHASSLTRDDNEPASVYMLYDDMEIVPRWVFNLGFYRMSLSAREKWGPNNVVVAPLDELHLRLALRHGRFIVLACHGIDGELISSRFRIAPPAFATPSDPDAHGLCFAYFDDYRSDPWTFLDAGQDLRFVYNSGCDCGVRAAEWDKALAPAEVRTFGRLSAVAEHIGWLWTDGPKRLQSIPH